MKLKSSSHDRSWNRWEVASLFFFESNFGHLIIINYSNVIIMAADFLSSPCILDFNESTVHKTLTESADDPKTLLKRQAFREKKTLKKEQSQMHFML